MDGPGDNGDQYMAPVDYVPNPSFSFPAQPPQSSSHGPRRTASLHLNPSTPQRFTNLERRSASTLPTFSFNASDTSGRLGDSPERLPALDAPSSVSRGLGHRRGASEFVGGTNKFGTPNFVSTSPVKGTDSTSLQQDAQLLGSPVRKRGHAHRRSAAVSAHDLHSILQPRDANIVTLQTDASSIMTSEPPNFDDAQQVKSDESSLPEQTPQARPRVGFANRIEFIPRPLSTISSEAESIISIPSHQASSTTSPLRPASFSPPNKRKNRSSRSSLAEVESASRSSFEKAPATTDCDDQMSKAEPDRPMTEPSSASSRMTSNFRDFSFPPRRPKAALDRRSSEPSLSLTSLQRPRRSSVSLREPGQGPKEKRSEGDLKPAKVSRKSSANKVKAWASAMMHRKKSVKRSAPPSADAEPTTPTTVDAMTPASEPDLEELFSHDPFSMPDDESNNGASVTQKMDLESFKDFNPNFGPSDDSGPVIDLDAALGPNKTPSRDGRSPGFGARRQLHSSRGNRDFNSPGSMLFHRRAESAPVLTPFDYQKTHPKSPSPMHSPMADVFEEEEYDMTEPSTNESSLPSESADACEHGYPRDDGLGIQDSLSLAPPTPTAASFHSDIPIMEDTIVEETGTIDIVEAHEEPRASTMTKSSDSSETPTILGDPLLSLVPPQAPFMTTPSTYAGSTFSTPEMSRRQESFDGQRLGTSASSATDCRTLSSFASERPDTRPSVDDVPSLTSSRSTMISSNHPSRRDMSEKTSSIRPRQLLADQQSDRRRKRASIQSLTKLMSGPFGESRNKLNMEQGNASSPSLLTDASDTVRKRENRLSKLLFWKNKGSRLSTASGI
ncbi:hypothetical protein CAC42_5694 [Sphaceloma murrayae]|uniref:Cell wall proline rich protein n=1 Tax=Sphaceloma murrayae TaxID=2082308 RepID=A0A2K1QYW3_9PEZI|nr:hypothetical protein CAC42_5694 [Sphaceloma murrayae]